MSQPSFDFGDDLPAEPTFTVRELADALNQVLRRGFYDGVWVRGEIEGFSERGGHCYFQLSEDVDGERASIPVSLFSGVRQRLRPLLARHRLRLGNGLAVRIHGRPDVFVRTGKLSLVMDGLDPTFTLGRLAADRDQLLRRLVAEGVLDANRRRRLSPAPLVLGLVTSRGSAAWHDVLHELHRSGIGFRVLHVDVRVQGDTAAAEVAAAIATLGRRPVDAVVVVRGGGARSDLAAFDHEVVARAIAACPVPVLTGLGHEIDRSVADEVAHTALKTPTACAAHLVDLVRSVQDRAEQTWHEVSRRAEHHLAVDERRLGLTAHRLSGRSGGLLEVAVERLDARADRLRRQVPRVLAGEAARVERAVGRAEGAVRRHVDLAALELDRAADRLAGRAPRALAEAERDLDGIDARVRALDPARTLARGWSITRRADGAIVRDASQLAEGDLIDTTFARGRARSRVEETTP